MVVEIILVKTDIFSYDEFFEQWEQNYWVPVGEDKGYDLNAINNKINVKTKIVFLCNPNNPTGSVVDKESLIDFLFVC